MVIRFVPLLPANTIFPSRYCLFHVDSAVVFTAVQASQPDDSFAAPIALEVKSRDDDRGLVHCAGNC